MNFQEYINTAWADHDKKTDEVMSQYLNGIEIVESETDLLAVSRLVTHVAVEHNFQFTKGLATLEIIFKHVLLTSPEAKAQVNLQITTLKYIADQDINISDCSISDRAIIFISAASSNLYRDEFDLAKKFITNAISASYALKIDDVAFKTLAMNCNNMAAQISEKTERSEIETKLMLDLAHYSRNFWEKAGTWLHVERAEYYLSSYYRLASDYSSALKHAKLCLQTCEKQKDENYELFYAHEAMALTCKEMNDQNLFELHLAEMKKYFSLNTSENQKIMQTALQKVEQ